MKKITISLITIMVLILFWTATSFAAKLEATISITPSSTEVKPGDTVTFTMKTTNITNSEDGKVYAIAGVLTYDKNFFEELNMSLTYNEENGKFTGMGNYANNTTVDTITLKVKSGATGTGTVSFTELTSSDGRDDYENGEASSPDVNITITAKQDEGNNEGGNNEGGNNEGGNNEGGNNEGGNNEGGNNEGGNNEGGNNEGGNNQGGNNEGGNNEGGNNEGGNNEGGNNQGGSNNGTNDDGSKKETVKPESTDNSKSSISKLPKTGTTIAIVLPIIGVLVVSSVVAFNKYRKYRGI